MPISTINGILRYFLTLLLRQNYGKFDDLTVEYTVTNHLNT